MEGMSTVSEIAGFYTVSEAAVVIGRSHSTVCRYIRQGILKAKHVGQQKLVEQSAAHAFSPPLPGNPLLRKRNRKRLAG